MRKRPSKKIHEKEWRNNRYGYVPLRRADKRSLTSFDGSGRAFSQYLKVQCGNRSI